MAFVHSFTYTPPKRYDGNAWATVKIEESADSESWADVETLALSPVDTDPTAPAERELTTEVATIEVGYFRLTPIDADADEGPTSSAVYSPAGATAVATRDDVENRLARSLTTAEATAVDYLLEAIVPHLARAAGRTSLDGVDTIPDAVRFVAVEAIVRVISNPEGLASTQETLGAHTHARSYGRGAAGAPGELHLTKTEELLVGHAINGATSGSTRIRSHVDDVWEALYS